MIPRERVRQALSRKEADRVPYCELGVDRALAEQIMGWGSGQNEKSNLEANAYTVEESKRIAQRLGLDNITFALRAPVYADKRPGKQGRLFYGDGQIKTEKDIERIQLPDPHDPAFYQEAERFVKNKGDYSAWLVTRIGIFPTMLSLGLENFSIALYDNRRFVETVMDLYFDWARVMADHVCQMGFDVFVTTDDLAFKTQPFFSPKIFREMVVPRYKRVVEKITIPWFIHSDGNIEPILKDFLSLGICGVHPNEKGAMDIRQIKRKYGHRVCLLGNVDLNLLGAGTPEEVDEEVRGLIRDVAPGGGYIVTSGNSLAGYLQRENVLALSEAVKKYGRYPIAL
jgi:uroporphyrinogen decarboxylase